MCKSFRLTYHYLTISDGVNYVSLYQDRRRIPRTCHKKIFGCKKNFILCRNEKGANKRPSQLSDATPTIQAAAVPNQGHHRNGLHRIAP